MDEMGKIFDALGSATRRRILDIVKNDPGCSIGEVAAEFDVTRIAVMKQIQLLEEAQLLISKKQGRKRCLFHNPVPIQLIYDRWTTEYSSLWASKMVDLKYQIESGVVIENDRETARSKKKSSG
jgi:predicted transcriptional regulator